MSDRLALLEPLLTAKIRKMATERLLFGTSLAPDKAQFTPAERNAVKLALLLLQIMNPLEELTDGETALIIGISVRTLRERREAEMLAEQNRRNHR